MKKTSKLIISFLLIAMIVASLSVTAFAETVTWSSFVGDEYTVMSETPFVSSNTAVVEVRYEGNYVYKLVAVGEGSATVNGGTWMGSACNDYVFNITARTTESNMGDWLTGFDEPEVEAPVQPLIPEENTTSVADKYREEFESNRAEASEKFNEKYESVNAEIEEDKKKIEEDTEEIKGFIGGVSIAVAVIWILVILLLIVGFAGCIYIFIEAPKCGMSRAWALMPLFSGVLGLIVFIVIRSSHKKSPAVGNKKNCPTCGGVHPEGTTVCSICGTQL